MRRAGRARRPGRTPKRDRSSPGHGKGGAAEPRWRRECSAPSPVCTPIPGRARWMAEAGAPWTGYGRPSTAGGPQGRAPTRERPRRGIDERAPPRPAHGGGAVKTREPFDHVGAGRGRGSCPTPGSTRTTGAAPTRCTGRRGVARRAAAARLGDPGRLPGCRRRGRHRQDRGLQPRRRRRRLSLSPASWASTPSGGAGRGSPRPLEWRSSPWATPPWRSGRGGSRISSPSW